MKTNRLLLRVLAVFVAALLIQTTVYAREEEKENCIKPKFTQFNPPNHSEVAPGSEISFHVKYADQTKISAAAKKIPMEITIEDRSLFLIVKAVLPESLKGTYARISLEAEAEQGCKSKDGWLLKISDAPEAATEVSDETSEREVSEATGNDSVTQE